nr:unnamed protein product [Callosobruchus analis]
MPNDRRGGNRVKRNNYDKRTEIRNFVKSLKCVQSHYCRSKTLNRIYLAGRMKNKKFWNAFSDFLLLETITFGSVPLKLTCVLLVYYLRKKRKTATLSQKCNFSFYEFIKKGSLEVEAFSFDCKKNLALPRVSHRQAYFSMQLNFHHIGIINGASTGKINRPHGLS